MPAMRIIILRYTSDRIYGRTRYVASPKNTIETVACPLGKLGSVSERSPSDGRTRCTNHLMSSIDPPENASAAALHITTLHRPRRMRGIMITRAIEMSDHGENRLVTSVKNSVSPLVRSGMMKSRTTVSNCASPGLLEITPKSRSKKRMSERMSIYDHEK